MRIEQSCVGRTNIDMNVIRLQLFPLKQTSDVSIWFTVERCVLREILSCFQEAQPQG